MIRALILTILLGGLPRACACAGSSEVSGASADSASHTADASQDAASQGGGSGYALPMGIGPASGGGKCTVPELVEADLQVRDPSDMSLEDRVFGTQAGELSVKSPEPCP